MSIRSRGWCAVLALVAACRPSAALPRRIPRPSTPSPAGTSPWDWAWATHDPNYVDAYYGPDSLRKAAADAESLSVAQVRTAAESLIAVLGDSVPAYADSLARLRHRYLRVQLGAMAARARMLMGERLGFDAEAEALYDAKPPHYPDAHYDSLLARLDSLLPGRGPLADRYQRFRDRLNIPAAKVDTVFRTAIAACRARTLAHMPLPPGERFDLEYVKGTPGTPTTGTRAVSQPHPGEPRFPRAARSRDRPRLPRGLSGTPRVQRAARAGAGARPRLGGDLAVSAVQPPSLIAEGSANYGIDMAFPPAERTAFERDSLFPLAGLDPRSPSGTPRCGRSWSTSTTRGTKSPGGTSTARSTRRARGPPCSATG